MLSDKSKEALKAALLKFGIELPATKVVKLEDVTLIDGTMLSVDKMEVGAAATFTGADGVAIPAEGEFELADGSTVVCVAGLITEIKPKEADKQPEAPEVPAGPNAEMTAILSRLTEIEKNFKTSASTSATLEAQLSETKKGLAVALSVIEDMNTNAVALNLEAQKDVKKKIDISKLNQFEKYKLAKYGEI